MQDMFIQQTTAYDPGIDGNAGEYSNDEETRSAVVHQAPLNVWITAINVSCVYRDIQLLQGAEPLDGKDDKLCGSTDLFSDSSCISSMHFLIYACSLGGWMTIH